MGLSSEIWDHDCNGIPTKLHRCRTCSAMKELKRKFKVETSSSNMKEILEISLISLWPVTSTSKVLSLEAGPTESDYRSNTRSFLESIFMFFHLFH